MTPYLKTFFYRVAWLLGGFALARWLTRNEARILCYHGFSYRDEHRFAPPLFMRIDTFRMRLKRIEQLGFQVISLDQLINRLDTGADLRHTLVLTVDDGWTGFAEQAFPEIRARNWPCTLYLTTWCIEHHLPVLNVLRRYLLWHGVTLPEPTGDDQEDWQVLQRLARQANIQLTTRQAGSLFRLCDIDTLAAMHQQGLDLQLHTHRHRVPAENHLLLKELEDNRQFLRRIVPTHQLAHFCYPSGEYRPEQFETLRKAGIRSATTTELGLVRHGDNPLRLKRLLDAENLSDLEFRAELSGFKSLLRRFKPRVRSHT